jgi:dihydrofolate synthase/folylpolyglutamate synthase
METTGSSIADPASEEVARLLARFRANAPPRSPVFDCAPVRAALARLGDPQEAAPSPVHITGTNGKGSTAAFLRAIAEASGLRVHVYTSPHLLRVNERIRLAGTQVSDARLAGALGRVAVAGPSLSYFEALTTAAFVLFAETPADIAIIEVGAGGAGDATNVLTRPRACVVSEISRDHEAMFGVQGVAAIAKVKAGIFRPGAPAVFARQDRHVSDVLREEALRVGMTPFVWSEDWSATLTDDVFSYAGRRLAIRDVPLGLPGDHQAMNAGLACAVADIAFPERIAGAGIAAGLRDVRWPARLQRLGPGPLNPDGTRTIYVDGAHNPGGVEALSRFIARHGRATPGRRAIIFAVQAAKASEAMLPELASVADMVIVCPLPDTGGQEAGPGASPDDLMPLIPSGPARYQRPDLASSLEAAWADGASEAYICGSLHLCAAALRLNGAAADD